MTLINQALATDSNINISGILSDPSKNPAPKLAGIKDIGGILTGGGFDLINFIFIIIGLLFFANLIIAGWEYMMGGGDMKKIAAASTRIVNGLIGLVLAFVAFIVVRLVTNVLGLGNLV